MAQYISKFTLMVTAMLALGGLGAAGAQATFSFTLEKVPVSVTGSIPAGSEEVFTTAEGTVKCTTSSLTGTVPSLTSSELKLEPHYSNCTMFGLTAHVNATPCYRLYTTPTAGSVGNRTGEPPHYKCPGGGATTFTPTLFGGSVCTLTMEEQTPTGGHVIYTNSGGAGKEMDLLLHTTDTGIHYKGTGGVCGNGETHSDGTYTGTWTLRAYEDGQAHDAAHQVGLTVS